MPAKKQPTTIAKKTTTKKVSLKTNVVLVDDEADYTENSQIAEQESNHELNIELKDWWSALFASTQNFPMNMSKHEFECVFNCGWGMLLVADKENIDKISEKVTDATVLGTLTT